MRWRKGRTLEPDWPIEHGYLVDIQGQPCVRTKLEVYPGADFEAKSFTDYMVLGMIMTAMPAVYAIPAVCAARARHRHLPRPAADHAARSRQWA